MRPAIQECEDVLLKFAESYGPLHNIIERCFAYYKANDLVNLSNHSFALAELEEELRKIANRHGLYYSPASMSEGIKKLMEYSRDRFLSEAECLLNFYGTVIKHYASVTHYALHVKWVTSGHPNIPYTPRESEIQSDSK